MYLLVPAPGLRWLMMFITGVDNKRIGDSMSEVSPAAPTVNMLEKKFQC